MNVYYNLCIGMTIAISVIMCLLISMGNLLEWEKKKRFIIAFAVIIVGASAEWLSVLCDHQENSVQVLQILAKSIDHAVAPLLTLTLVCVVKKKIPKALWVLAICHFFLELLSGKFGFIYYIADDGTYQHGSCYWIFMAVYLLCCAYFIIEYIKFAKNYQENAVFTLVCIITFLIFGVEFSILNSEVRVSYLCVSIAAVMLYVYYTDIVQCIDVLTGLLNRRCYETYISNLKNPMTLFLFDVDDFKNINDSYGHEYGDIALRSVAQTVRTVYGKHGNCYRIGGDEFAVISHRKIDMPELLNTIFFENVEKKRKENMSLPFVSVGYAMYDPTITDFDTVLKIADQNMYKWKAENKKKRRDQDGEFK